MKRKLTKKTLILLFTPIFVALIVMGIIFGIKFNNNENTEGNETTTFTDYTYNRVYLVDNDDVLIPLTIKYETFDSQAEELMYLLSMLKVDSSIASDEFNGLLPKECSVKSLDLLDGNLKINFNEDIATYKAQDELRIIESLVWTFTDLDYVDSVSLSMNDELLTHMPVNNLPINNPLDKHFGINNYLLTSSIMGSGTKVLSYYEKEIDEKFYYVPVTHYVNNNNELSIYDLTIETLFKNPGITSSLTVCRCIEDTEMLTSSIVNENILYLSLSEDILFDETTVSLDIYQLLKEVTVLLDVKDVSFLMELEEVPVNGVEEDEELKVSKIELNKYYV